VTRDIFLDETNPKKAVFRKNRGDKTPAFYRTSGLFPFVGNIVSFLVSFLDLWDKPIR
jgi:hypothetical protein